MKEKMKSIVGIFLFILLMGIAAVLCFYHLDEAGIQNWDEARHIVNAYEMLKSQDYWIHTYLWETDYFNYKPPLSMWFEVLNMRIWGVNLTAARIGSSILTFLMLLVVSLFLRFKMKVNWMFVNLFVMCFLSHTEMFFFHMVRSADADALFVFFFAIAILFLVQSEKNPWLLSGFAFCMAMGFMAKCLHVGTGAVIFMLYLPRLFRKLELKHYFAAILAGGIPVGVWGIVRYFYDGTVFFAGMFGQEVASKVQAGKDYLAYVRYIFETPSLALIVAAGVVMLLILGMVSEKRDIVRNIIKSPVYGFALWAAVPFAVYSASGSFLQWYIYGSLIALFVTVAYMAAKCYQQKTGNILIGGVRQ